MSFLMRQVAHCDVCGHEWLTDKVPSHCAKCKSRKWNQGQRGPLDQARGFETNVAAPLKDEPIGKEIMTALIEDARQFIANSKHAVTCKCLMCQPPKSPKSSS